MMIRILVLSFTFLANIFVFGQNVSFVNSSFEYNSSCVVNLVPSHSQFGNVVSTWENMLPVNVSTADYFSSMNQCLFTGFSSLTNIVTRASNQASHGCKWGGVYLNYYEANSIDNKYREYIGQEVDLITGVTYTLTIDLARSSHNSSDDLEVDLAVYGYNGNLPASHFDYCLINSNSSNATQLGNVDFNLITTSFQNFTITFTPTEDFQYLVIGGADCGTSATAIGYAFIDNVRLSASDNSILNPVIEYFGSNTFCSYNCIKEPFTLTGNAPPPGVTVNWGQSPNNPEPIVFQTPNATNTGIVGSGQHSFIAGDYEFYYSFTQGGNTATDTVIITVNDLPWIAMFNAGTYTFDCNYHNASYAYNERAVQLEGGIIDNDLLLYGLEPYWTMIRENGTIWRFPNGCNPGDGFDEGDVHTGVFNTPCSVHTLGRTNSFSPVFGFRNAQDTIQFIWNIDKYDECNNLITLRDTVEVIVNDVDFIVDPFAEFCVGDSTIIHQGISPDFRILEDNPNLTFNWSYSPNNGGLTISNNGVSDSLHVTGNAVGYYGVTLEVTDNTTNCTWSDVTYIIVSDCLFGTPPTDCNLINNDVPDGNLNTFEFINRSFFMNAFPNNVIIGTYGYGSWWSMIRQNGTEWTFPNGCVPYDGFDEGDVFSEITLDLCANPSSQSPSANDAKFYFRNAVDTVSFIWHNTKLNTVTNVVDTLIDTTTIFLRDVDFAYSHPGNNNTPTVYWASTCEDTLLLHQLIDPDLRTLTQHPDLTYSWEIVKPTSTGWQPLLTTTGSFVDPTVADSALLLTVDPGVYAIRLEVTHNASGCQWYDILYIERILPVVIDAGPDSYVCHSYATGDFVWNATGSINIGNPPSPYGFHSSWWSVISDNGSEWVFDNPCVPYNGSDDGNVFAYFPNGSAACGDVNPGHSYAPNALFGMRLPAQNDFIWHMIDPCTGDTLVDTVSIGFQVLDSANAGPDFVVNCNVVTLNGNLSTFSSANSGAYLWEQIGGPTTVTMLSAQDNIAYFSTASLPPGTYDFEYTLGYFPCITYDTVAVTISNAPPPSTITMTATSDTVCVGNDVTFTAAGGQQYQFLVDGVVIQPFSPFNTFTYGAFSTDHEVTVIATNSLNNCLELLDVPLDVHVAVIDTPAISVAQIIACEGENIVLAVSATNFGQYNWSGPNSFSATTQSTTLNNLTTLASGYYYVNYSTSFCTSLTDSVLVSVNPVFNHQLSLALCATDSVFLAGSYQHSDGVYIDSLQTLNSCDSIVTTTVTFLDTTILNQNICDGDSSLFSGVYQTLSGSYFDVYTSSIGCDSVVQTDLQVNSVFQTNFNYTICSSDSLFAENAYQNQTGIYRDTLSTLLGCDSVIVSNLLVLDTIFTNLSSDICDGDSLFVFQNYESTAGVYTEYNSTVQGCDSVVIFTLNILPVYAQTIYASICDNDSLFVQGAFQNTSGIYVDTLSSSIGCDSIISTTLILNNTYYFNNDVTICDGDSVYLNNQYQFSQGIYFDNYATILGCDSIIETSLFVLESPIALFELDTLLVDMYYGALSTENLSTGASSYIWDFMEGIYNYEFEPQHTYLDPGMYEVQLIAVAPNGCTDQYTQSVIITPVVSIFVPNTFTPNGDGINDTFFFEGFGISEEDFSFVVFNRWGQIIYETKTFQPWDGKFKGLMSQSDAYLYIINYKDVLGKAGVKEGHIILLK